MGKGDDFERDQCRFLSLWWTSGKAHDVFWRNRRRKRSNVNSSLQLGDLGTTDPLGVAFVSMWNVEFKTGYSKTKRGKKIKNVPWDLLDLIDGRSEDKPILRFWEQTLRDSLESERIPLLIFKRDYRTPSVCINVKTYLDIVSYNANKYFENNFCVYGMPDNKASLMFFGRDEFFEYFQPRVVHRMLIDKKKLVMKKVKSKRLVTL